MKVFIDGKEVVVVNNDVKIRYEVEPVDGITEESDLDVTLTCEGIILDLVEVTRASAPSAEVTYTDSSTTEEIIDSTFIIYS